MFSRGALAAGVPGSKISAVPSNRLVPASPPVATASAVCEDVQRQVGEWDREMDDLDKKQEQLLRDQWKMLRLQMQTLMTAISEIRSELAAVKEGQGLVETVEKMMLQHDGHSKNHANVLERVSYLEDYIGESADKHSQIHGEHQEHKATMETRLEYIESMIGESAEKHDEHKTTMEARLEYIETMMGDSADKHAEAIQDATVKLKDLHTAIEQTATMEHHSSLEERVKYMEGFLGESADKHEEHKTTVETRLEYIESLIGDSADKHATEIKLAQGKLGDLHKALQECAQKEHHNSLEKRLDYLEKFLGESADKHDKDLADHKKTHIEHKETMETRLEFIESLIGDSADKHSKEIDEAKKKLGSIESAVAKCAKSEHHSSLEQRLDYLEKVIGESADKHAQDLAEHRNSSDVTKRSLEAKVDNIERVLKEHAIDLDSKGHKNDIEKLERSILSDIGKRLASIEDKHLQDFVKRMNVIESKHAQDSGEVMARVADIDKALKQCAQLEHYLGLDRKLSSAQDQQVRDASSHRDKLSELQAKVAANDAVVEKFKKFTEGRLEGAERSLSDANESLARKLSHLEAKADSIERVLKDHAIDLDSKGHKSDIEKLEQSILSNIEKRLTSIEDKHLQDFVKRMNLLESKHTQDSGEVKARVADIDKALKQCAQLEQYLGLDRKLTSAQDQQARDVESHRGKLSELQSRVAANDAMVEKIKNVIEGRLEGAERNISDANDNLLRKLSNIEAAQIKEQIDRESQARQERNVRESQEIVLERRVETFERSMSNEIQRIWHELGILPKEPQVLPTTTYVMSPRTSYVAAPPHSAVRISPPHSARVLPGTAALAHPTSCQSVVSSVVAPSIPYLEGVASPMRPSTMSMVAPLPTTFLNVNGQTPPTTATSMLGRQLSNGTLQRQGSYNMAQ